MNQPSTLAAEIHQHLAGWMEKSLPVQVHYFDRTRGETEENYLVLGDRDVFSSHIEFAAVALLAMAQRMGLTAADYCDMKVFSCEPESWMLRRGGTLKPGSLQCFPPAEILGFQPPEGLQPKLQLVPRLSANEECLVCECDAAYVLLYWHTTG